MENKPLVSIIMPAYNSENTIRKSINSVLKQLYINWELIIINDYSTDSTLNIINEYLDDNRVVLINNDTNCGIALSRNRGILMSKGKYIAFLDSDDIWNDDKLSIQIEYMEINSCKFTYTSNQIINNYDEVVGNYFCPRTVDYNMLKKYNPIHTLTVMVDSVLMRDNLMPNIKHEDYATWLLILKKGIVAHGISKTTAQYRVSNKSKSSNKIKTLSWTFNIYYNILDKSLLISILYMIRFVLYTVKKYKSNFYGDT